MDLEHVYKSDTSLEPQYETTPTSTIDPSINLYQILERMSLGTTEDCEHCQHELRRAIATCSRSPPSCHTNQLLHSGFDWNQADLYGDTPLIVAVKRGLVMAVKALIQNKCDVNSVNQDGRSALHYAAKNGNQAILALLIDHESDLDVQDQFGFTPLMMACRQGHHQAAQCLLEARCNVNLENTLGETALFYAAKDRSYRSTDNCARLLLEHGASFNHLNHQVCSALHMAVLYKKINVVKMLLAKNCWLECEGMMSFIANARNIEMTVTPLEVAFLTGNLDVCEILISVGCDTNKLLKHVRNPQFLEQVRKSVDPMTSAPDFPDWFLGGIQTPQDLRLLCRTSIRQSLNVASTDALSQLPLPEQIIEYLEVPELTISISP